jgi:glycosyltransferase involved in cell wall biosynthesis
LERVLGADRVDAFVTPAAAPVLAQLVHCRVWTPRLDQCALPALLRRLHVDVLHSPLFTVPRLRVCPYVCTIHDVIPLSRPDLTHPEFVRFFLRHIPVAQRASSHIVAVSHHARQEILVHLHETEERVTTIYEPVHPHFTRRSGAHVSQTLTSLGLASHYFLYVGALARRKNVTRLLEAYAQLRRWREAVPPLVLVGGLSGDGYDPVSDIERLALRQHVHRLGRVSDEALACLYTAALALVFPSLYEGFGLPVVEAMACGTPVITSDTSALPEVAGGAAQLVNPLDVGAIARAMEALLACPAHRQRLVHTGLARARHFTLERQGATLVRLYTALMD